MHKIILTSTKTEAETLLGLFPTSFMPACNLTFEMEPSQTLLNKQLFIGKLQEYG